MGISKSTPSCRERICWFDSMRTLTFLRFSLWLNPIIQNRIVCAIDFWLKFLVYNDTGMTPEINTPTGLDIGPTRTSWANELSSARFWCRIIIPLPVAWWSTMYANRMPVFTDAASISNVHLRGIAESISPLLVNIIFFFISSFLFSYIRIFHFKQNKRFISYCFCSFFHLLLLFFYFWLFLNILFLSLIVILLSSLCSCIFFCFVLLFCFVLFCFFHLRAAGRSLSKLFVRRFFFLLWR